MTGTVPVEVTMHIPAAPEDLFPYFTDPVRYVQWMGSQAKLEPVPGGVYRIRMPDGFEAAGEFLQVNQPHQVTFTWGFADDDAARRTKHERGEAPSGSDMPAGSTRVTVTLDREDGRSWNATFRQAQARDARVHDARHTAATFLIEQGVYIRVVQLRGSCQCCRRRERE